MSTAKKTLIILTPGFPKNEADTACLPFLQNFIKELNEQFHSLNVVVLAFDHPFISTTYQWNNNEIISFNGWKKKKIGKLFKWMRIWRKLKEIKHNNDLIGIFSLWCGECAYLGDRFAKKNNIQHFCWIQGQDAKKENHYVRRIGPRAKELIAISDLMQNEFKRDHSIRPAHVIPIGIRQQEFLKENAVRDIDILGVGSLIPLKRYDLFIEVINNIKQYFPNIKAVLCGKGRKEIELKMLIEKYGLQKNITLTGELSHVGILQLMIRSKVFLHPSDYEGLGVVCIEALYAGCHTISFVQPMNYNIEHWHIVKTKDEMIEKVKAILSDHDTEYSSVLTFTMQETVKNIMDLYDHKEETIS